jgi:hypothetical protein
MAKKVTKINGVELKGGGSGSSTTDLAGIPTSTSTASTPTFFDGSKNLISMTASLWGTFWNTFSAKNTPVDADTIEFGDSASSFVGVKTTFLNLWDNYFKGKADALYSSLTYTNNQDKKFNFKLSFNGVRIIEDYWIDAGTISTVTLSAGLSILEYSTDNQASYQSTYPVVINAGTRVHWRCTYASNSFIGSANLKGSFTNTI